MGKQSGAGVNLERSLGYQDQRLARSIAHLLPNATAESKNFRPTNDTKTTCPRCFGKKGPTSNLCRSCQGKRYQKMRQAAKKAKAAGVTLHSNVDERWNWEPDR